MHYINKQGGTRSQALSQEAQKIWEWSISHQINLKAEHVPRKQNVLIETLSELKSSCHEWEINQEVLSEIFHQWDTSNLDQFAASQIRNADFTQAGIHNQGHPGMHFQ